MNGVTMDGLPGTPCVGFLQGDHEVNKCKRFRVKCECTDSAFVKRVGTCDKTFT